MKEKFRRIRKTMVAGHEFKIVWKPLKDNFGWTDVDAKTIYVCSKRCNTFKIARDTICHEANHAVYELTGLAHNPHFMEIEEQVVRANDYLLLPAVDDITARMMKKN